VVVVELEVEALAPGLEQVRAVELPSVVPTTRLPPTVIRTRSVKSRAASSLVSATSIPRSSASEGALTRLTSSSCGRRARLQRGEGEQPGVALGDAAEVLDLDAVHAGALGQGHGEAPEPAGEGRNGPSTSMSSAEMAGMFTAVETTPPVSAATTCSRSDARAVLGLRGGGAEVRGHHDVVVAENSG
jgi:hypothetical protein